MARTTWVLLVCTLGGSTPVATVAGPATAPSPLESAFSDVAGKTGNDYLAARSRLLAMDRNALASFLESKHAASSDQVERLQIQALLARLRDPERVDKALSDAIAEAGKDRGLDVGGHPVRPMPGQGAKILLNRLGDDAAPVATELLTRGLTDNWEPWKREIPLGTLLFLGRTRTSRTEWAPVKDWRAGWALLWVAEHEQDPGIADYARAGLQGFLSEELIQAVEAVSQRATSDEVKRRFQGVPDYLRHKKTLEEIRSAAKAAASSPSKGGPLATRPNQQQDAVNLPARSRSQPFAAPSTSQPSRTPDSSAR